MYKAASPDANWYSLSRTSPAIAANLFGQFARIFKQADDPRDAQISRINATWHAVEPTRNLTLGLYQ